MYIVYLEQNPCDNYANIETQIMRVQKKIVCPQPGKEEKNWFSFCKVAVISLNFATNHCQTFLKNKCHGGSTAHSWHLK